MSEAIILLLCDNCRTVTGNDARAEMPARCFACGANAWRVLAPAKMHRGDAIEVLAGPVQK